MSSSDMGSAQRQSVLLPSVQECDDITGRLSRLADRVDVLPSQIGARFEFLFLQTLENLKRAKIAMANANETLKQIALAN